MRYVLAGFERSACSSMIVLHAAEMADRYEMRLHVLMVARPASVGLDVAFDDASLEFEICRAESQLERLREELDGRCVDPKFSLRMGEPAAEIARYAREYCPLHVIVGEARSMVPGFLSIGSRVRRLLAHTDCRLTVIRANGRECCTSTPASWRREVGAQ
jgi:nucleotide-binding universal stress UspA family protein